MTPETLELVSLLQSASENVTSPLFFDPLLQNLIDSEVRDPQPKSGGDNAWHEDADGDQRVAIGVAHVAADVLTLEVRPAH